MEASRRIITGVDGRGRSTVLVDGTPSQVMRFESAPAMWIAEHWVAGGTGRPALANVPPPEWELEPPAGGSRFRTFQLPPDDEMSAAGYALEAGKKGADIGVDASDALMHATETLDLLVVISGRAWLVLDTGETELGPGDCVVQRATRHAWRNRAAEPCVMAAVLLSARAGGR